jgi:hypothetical protein
MPLMKLTLGKVFTVLAGRTAAQNERVAFKESRRG